MTFIIPRLPEPIWAIKESQLASYWNVIAHFETGTGCIDWKYVEDLGDGRGPTFTSFGMTNEDRYRIKGLGRKRGKEFIEWWTTEGYLKPSIRQSILNLVNMDYAKPAIEVFKAHGCIHPITLCFLLDTSLQHGAGIDKDSLGAIVDSVPWNKNVSEYDWLKSLMAKRRQVLTHPSNGDTAEVWRLSLDRVDYFETWLKALHQENR
jgi:Glycosyl hydrolase family 46